MMKVDDFVLDIEEISKHDILFLDVDGVLNNKAWFSSLKYQSEVIRADEEVYKSHLDPRACALLNEFVKKTGVKVVMSSVWRLFHTARSLQSMFAEKGLYIDILGKTPNIGGGVDRGRAIERVVIPCRRENPNFRFVILDDGSDMEPYMDKLVKTTFENGLEQWHLEEAEKILEEQT